MNERPQRIRQNKLLRDLTNETLLQVKDLIMPIFIHEGLDKPHAIASLPGIYQYPLNELNHHVQSIINDGIKSVILFGIPNIKDEIGSEASNPNGVIQRAIRQLKIQFPDLLIIADCCLCEYTDHGHCGVMNQNKLNHRETLTRLKSIALSYAKEGVDIIAPSGMMDGMVTAIRSVLDDNNFEMLPVMSYAVKYASAFYGPFRDAAGSEGVFKGDRKHHQLGIGQREEALREAELDSQEGADFLMVKPAMAYLDIIRDLKNTTHVPLAAYHVSGEYAMIKHAAQAGAVDEQTAFEEQLIAIKRAGAQLIITYYAQDMAQYLNKVSRQHSLTS